MHATSAGLKAFTSWAAAEGIEEARKCCGGHGYSMSSGLPSLFAEYVPSCTYEGDNVRLSSSSPSCPHPCAWSGSASLLASRAQVILYLQTARYLMKALQQAQTGTKLKGGAKYLNDLAEQAQPSPVKSVEGFLCPHFQLHAHKHHARSSILSLSS